ncbi:hypothetical protein BDQ94DRAFT_150331 [Aspergillus welwitschiae]|uniref:Uncharacterized protein n=1 Tax=Aspergillus welwitschiae TaxID=1341132 RepID=A0A3F3PRE8_9EURO|nr:hypothetical protein BDQ94DRAFT_150331 [Aspergillus welwitschiae]RDH29474.1 hypothetical protein BDQ94DRAFT_150331 [Aspergillus welwitschiae]
MTNIEKRPNTTTAIHPHMAVPKTNNAMGIEARKSIGIVMIPIRAVSVMGIIGITARFIVY